ncbi:MAG: YdeI/OmpD-associated family protein [Saprospiraceae bacterium]
MDKYLVDGCMRCAYGGTPRCKVNTWREPLEALRQIALESGLTEEIKWGVPVYTHHGKNVVMVSAFKDYCFLSFFKGVLLADKQGILVQRGNAQSDRMFPVTHSTDIAAHSPILQAYIAEAIAIEESGEKVVFQRNPEPVPPELEAKFVETPAFKKAFYALTPGKQRGYIIHFSQPKQASTRTARIEKNVDKIMRGEGFHDDYRKNKRQ